MLHQGGVETHMCKARILIGVEIHKRKTRMLHLCKDTHVKRENATSVSKHTSAKQQLYICVETYKCKARMLHRCGNTQVQSKKATSVWKHTCAKRKSVSRQRCAKTECYICFETHKFKAKILHPCRNTQVQSENNTSVSKHTSAKQEFYIGVETLKCKAGMLHRCRNTQLQNENATSVSRHTCAKRKCYIGVAEILNCYKKVTIGNIGILDTLSWTNRRQKWARYLG